MYSMMHQYDTAQGTPFPPSPTGQSSLITSSSSYVSPHQPTPFYIDNILAPTATPAEVDGPACSTSSSELIPIGQQQPSPAESHHHLNGVVQSPNEQLVTDSNGTQHLSTLSTYYPSQSCGETPGLQYVPPTSPTIGGVNRPNPVSRPLVPTPIAAVPGHTSSIIPYGTGGFARTSGVYEAGGGIPNAFNGASIQYAPTHYGGPHQAPPPAHGSALYPYSRHDYASSWFWERQQFGKG